MKNVPFVSIAAILTLGLLTGCGVASEPKSNNNTPAETQSTSAPATALAQAPSTESTYKYLGNENCQAFSISAHDALERYGLTCEQALTAMSTMSLEEVKEYLDRHGIESYFENEAQLREVTEVFNPWTPEVIMEYSKWHLEDVQRDFSR